MRPYLVCHDYGTGGVWWWITAASSDEITAAFRDVTVFDEPPPWWSDELDGLTPRRLITDKPDEALALLAR
jgi:hypothetical protein